MKPKIQNFVAKYARKFNKAAIHKDKKKEAKIHKYKHKKDYKFDHD